VLLDLVPASAHQPDLFDAVRRQKLSPLIDRINDRYGRCAIGFGLLPPDVRAFKGHAAFHRVPERNPLSTRLDTAAGVCDVSIEQTRN
jgi:hypothetical protein